MFLLKVQPSLRHISPQVPPSGYFFCSFLLHPHWVKQRAGNWIFLLNDSRFYPEHFLFFLKLLCICWIRIKVYDNFARDELLWFRGCLSLRYAFEARLFAYPAPCSAFSVLCSTFLIVMPFPPQLNNPMSAFWWAGCLRTLFVPLGRSTVLK